MSAFSRPSIRRLNAQPDGKGWSCRRNDGAVMPTLMPARVITLDGEQCILSVTQDISERERAETRIRRLNRVYAVLSGIDQAIVRLRQPQALSDEACRVIVEDGGFRAAWVGLVDPDGRRVRVVAEAGATEGYVDKVDIVLGDERRGKGPTGVSISERRHVASQDSERDPAMAPWRENALRHGYRSSASFPLIVRDAAVGAFTMYADESGFFDDQQIELLDEPAADPSFAMERAVEEVRRRQAEEELERRGARLEELLGERERNLELLERSLSSRCVIPTPPVTSAASPSSRRESRRRWASPPGRSRRSGSRRSSRTSARCPCRPSRSASRARSRPRSSSGVGPGSRSSSSPRGHRRRAHAFRAAARLASNPIVG